MFLVVGVAAVVLALAAASAPRTAGPSPADVGAWSTPVDWPAHPKPPDPSIDRILPVHMVLLETGQVLAWDAFDVGLDSETLYDPQTNSFSYVPSGLNLFCVAVTTDAKGKALLFGGHVTPWIGTTDTTTFDGRTRTWQRLSPMSRARWYATAATLSDGRVLVLSGDQISQDDTPPITPLSFGSDTIPEVFDPGSNSWTRLDSAARRMPLYPFMFLLPDGRVLDAGPGKVTRILDVGRGTWTIAATSGIDGGSAVMYRPGKVLKAGGWAVPNWPDRDGEATGAAETIDMNQPSPQWQATGSMQFPRFYHNLTVLADGTVLVVGGGTDSEGVKSAQATTTPELWDPSTGTWRAMAPQRDPRLYHSTSILLPDGRVLSGGGGRYGSATDYTTSEIYSPPYLFKGARPTIVAAPSAQGYGRPFTVGTPDASRIASAAFVRLGSETHGLGEDQRYVPLSIASRGATSLTLQAPTASLAPPGVYMLFLVSTEGVPSVAWMVTLGQATADSQPPSTPTGLGASASRSTVSLTWNPSTDNDAVRRYSVYRGTTSGFTASSATLVATSDSTAFSDNGLAAGTYYYRVTAEDWSGNVSGASGQASATVVAAPAGGGGGGGGGGAVDLQIGMTGPATASVGDTFDYLVSAQNLGPAGANGVVATIKLPDEVELVSIQFDRGQGCTGTSLLSCNLDFLSGALVAHVRLTVTVKAAGTLLGSASITANQPDWNAANNTASVTTAVAGSQAAVPQQAVLALARVGTGPVRLRSTKGLRTITVVAILNHSARVRVSVAAVGSRKALTLERGTVIGTTALPKRSVSASGAVPAGRFGLRAVLDATALAPGRTYALTVTATAAGGTRTSLQLRFRP